MSAVILPHDTAPGLQGVGEHLPWLVPGKVLGSLWDTSRRGKNHRNVSSHGLGNLLPGAWSVGVIWHKHQTSEREVVTTVLSAGAGDGHRHKCRTPGEMSPVG